MVLFNVFYIKFLEKLAISDVPSYCSNAKVGLHFPGIVICNGNIMFYYRCHLSHPNLNLLDFLELQIDISTTQVPPRYHPIEIFRLLLRFLRLRMKILRLLLEIWRLRRKIWRLRTVEFSRELNATKAL